MIDWIRIEELRQDVGDDEFGVILRLFLDEFEGVLDRLQEHDLARLPADLGFLRDCAQTLGFHAFGILCGAAERRLTGQGATGIDRTALLQCYAASRQELIRGLRADQAVTGLCLC